MVAALFTLAVLLWQFLTVRYNYAGNWTGLFCTGSRLPVPPSLAFEHIYQFPNSFGYDGQFYHYVAHDPMLRGGLSRYIDAPRLRYQRILVPLLTFVLAAGKPRFIDAAYVFITLLCLFAGVYWLGRYAESRGRHPAWGLAFALVPAVVVSIDRLTVDLALAALSVAFALYLEEPLWKLYLVLLLAPLARETGSLLTAAYCLSEFSNRRFRRAVLFSTSILPFLGWYLFLKTRTPPYFDGWLSLVPFSGFLGRIVHPIQYPFIPAVAWLAFGLDYLALTGMLLGFALAIRLALQKLRSPEVIACLLFTLMGMSLGLAGFWEDIYGFGRIFSPLLLLLALRCPSLHGWLTAVPMCLVVPRTGLQISPQILGIFHGFFG